MWLLGMVEAIIEDLVIPTVLRGYLTHSDGIETPPIKRILFH